MLDGVSFSVNSGEYVSLLGPSGSGKTVLLRAIAGFETLQGGRVLLKGEDVTSRPPYLAWRRLRVSEFRALSASFGVRQCRLRSAQRRPADVSDSEARARTLDMLDLVGLKGLEDRGRPPDLRRTEAARRARAHAGDPAETRASRRASRRARRQSAPSNAQRAAAHPRAARHSVPSCDRKRDRGAGDGRPPDRARQRSHQPVRHARAKSTIVRPIRTSLAFSIATMSSTARSKATSFRTRLRQVSRSASESPAAQPAYAVRYDRLEPDGGEALAFQRPMSRANISARRSCISSRRRTEKSSKSNIT